MTTPEQLYSCFLQCTGVEIDSRKIKPGNLFFALKGTHADGNQYAAAAVAAGARYAVVNDPAVAAANPNACLLVPNVLTALQELATRHRQQFTIPFVAITGSNGKTTSKELLYAVLSSTYTTQATQGNLNNHIGVPLTLLALKPGVQMAVIEMGANKQGDINELCSIALPNFGLITNIGKAHLEGFGGIEGVQKGKGEMFEYLDGAEGRAFVNLNDVRVAQVGYYLHKATTYGSTRRANIYAESLGCNPFLKVRWHLPKALRGQTETGFIDIDTQLTGEYNLDNVIAAIAVGHHFKVSPPDIARAIHAYVPQNNRSQIVQMGTNTVILDAYNANPTSMQNALLNFNQLPAAAKVVIAGDMLEMGEYSEQEHTGIVKQLQTMNLQHVALVGPEFGKVCAGTGFLHFNTAAAAKEWFKACRFEHTHILLKGSRGMAMEQILG
ncbi:UDP-N-acetylmuramoyl-tripeptide--D-alanyl-D-alanine ligase [Sphingobacteriales bacterium UPWRP_1]|nr:hypothetical protein B6N25_01475 [Sphingobacteriales bacterium TSM_CSS]PSJ74965.1 UDP-N-acetylmuramoyl-tripeptide--D-alanyl-D-alanine ligase [Sphingobacteriales bacterium UPWRP_1]